MKTQVHMWFRVLRGVWQGHGQEVMDKNSRKSYKEAL